MFSREGAVSAFVLSFLLLAFAAGARELTGWDFGARTPVLVVVDPNNNRVLSTDANGNRTEFVYDGANRLTARTDALGTLLATTTRFTHDRVGNLLEEKDGRTTGKTFDVKNTYDELNRLKTSEDGEANVASYEYDPDGNRTAVIEPKGPEYRTEYDYGELNELLEVRMPDGGVYSYDYDAARNRTKQTDGEKHVVRFTYDRLNRMERMIQDPFNYVTLHAYDPNGNEIQLTDPKGQVITFDYDELNRLKSKIYDLTAADLALFTRTHRIDYDYDPNDNLIRIDETKSSGTDPPVVVSSFKGYDNLDRLDTETDAWGRRLTYDYDPQGNRTLLIDPDQKRTVYAYDELNRLETLTLDDQQVVRYEYFPDGLKKTVTNPNGTVSTYEYDAADRMTDISHSGPAGVVSSYSYDYDPNSNRKRQVEQNAGRTETTEYTYDFVNRLKTVTYPDRTTRYEYDKSGNRIQEVTTGAVASDETFHYDAINRLERITDNLGDEDVAYLYDPNGNTTSKTAGGVTTNFFFDIRNQLGEVRQAGNILGRYGYDYDGRRILKIGDDGRRQYTYDQLSVVTEADQVNSTVSKYDYGMDQLVRLDNRGEGRSFFHLDFLGSTVGLTDPAGGSRQSIFYDAWGNERDRIGASANNFTFTGHELDEETGLIYAKARFYDAEVGRFLSQDSLLGDADEPPSLHRYFYANANPTRFTDPTGHFSSIKDFGKGAFNVVMEPFRQVADVIVAGVAGYAMEIDAENIELNSMLGKAQYRRMEEGQGATKTAAKGVGGTVFAVGTVGIGPAIVSHIELAQAVSRGEITIDEYDAALTEMAGGQAAAAAIAKVAAGRSTARTNTGLQVQPKAASPVRIIEGNRGTAAIPEGPVIEMVQNPSGVWVAQEGAATATPATALSTRGSGNLLSVGKQPAGLLGPGAQPKALLEAGSLDDVIAANYQRYYNEAASSAIARFNAGRISISHGQNWRQVLGQRIDAEARGRMLNFLEREGIAEGPGADVLVNRWLRDPSGSGRYRIPDIMLRQSGRILEGTIGDKAMTDPQIVDFRTYSGGFKVEIVRPQTPALKVK